MPSHQHHGALRARPRPRPASRPTARCTTKLRPLAPAEIAQLREMLLQQRTFRVEQLGQLARPGRPGPLGSADAEIGTELASGARAALHDVQSALWRMDEGRYGLCTACGQPQTRERLEILPQAALCMPCQRPADPAA